MDVRHAVTLRRQGSTDVRETGAYTNLCGEMRVYPRRLVLGGGKRCFIIDVVDDRQGCVRVRVLDEVPLSRVERRLARCTRHVDKLGRIGRTG